MKRWMIGLLACALLFVGCGEQTPLSKSGAALDTVCAVTVYTTADEPLLDGAFSIIANREALWSRTIETSDVACLNAANGEAVTMDPATAALLATVAAFHTEVAAFDITTAPLTDLWKAAEAADELPTEAALLQALDSVNGDYVALDGTTARLTNGAQIDLGGVAKGQIADEIAEYLRANGCGSALIDLGGNIVAVGTRDGRPFRIGIAHPTEDDTLAATVAVSDKAVVTSGSQERGFSVEGVRYSHILDPTTGIPVQNDLLSVTIVCDSACQADMLSTACFVLGYEQARTLIDGWDGAEAVFVKANGDVVVTAGIVLA